MPPRAKAAAPPLGAARAAFALAAAESARASAQSAYDAARLDLAATMADEAAALTRLEEVRVLADAAALRADVSTRTLAALVRTMVQHGSGTATLDALLGEQGSAGLLSRLGTVERISMLTGNMSEIRTLVDRDTQRAATLKADLATAEAAALSFPLAEKQDALATAEVSLSQATAAFASASGNAEAALATSARPSVDRATRAASQLAGILGARLSTQGWATPAVGSVNDGFGPRPDLPLPGVLPFHSGTDLAAACGSPVYAASAGVVAQTGLLGSYGNWVLIDHGDGVTTGYAHIADDATLVVAGQSVTAGQVIAGVGSTGASTGCHLHVEVRIDGTALDPQPFFADRGIDLGVG
ncbi:M23 family metallopeptidase [Cryobacterium adonitolivorans]|uniref:M23 family metallopeptidase n=1 Tax=Cryobacterium adonitolivorans TaxID=1259189 RepID=UPI00141B85C1|nr:M23 family metallopeptidase [Cryobacterium adonitolivorans]